MTGLEIGAAIVALVEIAYKLSKHGVRSYRSFRGAEEEAEMLISSTSSFSSVLQVLGTTLKRLRDSSVELTRHRETTASISEISTLASQCYLKIREAFRRLEPFENADRSRFALFRAKIIWIMYDKQDLKVLLASLEPLKSNISILEGALNINIIHAYLEECHRTGRIPRDDAVKEM